MKEKYTKRDLQDAFDAARRMNATGNKIGRAFVERKYRNFSEYFEAKYPKPLGEDCLNYQTETCQEVCPGCKKTN